MNAMGGMDMKGMSMMSMMPITWNTSCVVFLFDILHARNQTQFMMACAILFVVKTLS